MSIHSVWRWCALVGIGSVLSRHVCAGNDPSLLLHWTFDDPEGSQVSDASGNGNIGEVWTGGEIPRATCGRVGQARAFHQTNVGTYGRGLFHGAVAGLPIGNSPRTIMAWIFIPTGAREGGIIAGYGEGGSNTCWLLVAYGSSLVWEHWEDGAEVGETPMAFDVWHHVAATYDGETRRLYVDGVPDPGSPAPLNTPGSEFHVGGEYKGDSNEFTGHFGFDGLIDEVKLYDRALTETEIVAALDADALPVLESAVSPTALWSADGAAKIEEVGADTWRVATGLSNDVRSAFYRLVTPPGFGTVEWTSICVGDSGLEMEAKGSRSVCPEERTVTLPDGVWLALVRVPAGRSEMGSPPEEASRRDDEGPVHTVTIGYDFYMGKYEVTQAQWLAVMKGWPAVAPDAGHGAGDAYPAYFVSWNDAKSFVAALNAHVEATGQGPLTVRLPSEAEWEYACRVGSQRRFYFGDSTDVADLCDDGIRGRYMWYCGTDVPQGAKAVGTRLPNLFGLYDMHGNLGEWCEDYQHDSYEGAPEDGSAWLVSASSPNRVLRGGAWSDSAAACRCASRDYRAEAHASYSCGFRLAAGVE